MDPFFDAYAAAIKEETKNKLLNASIMWNILTNEETKTSDDSLYTVLIANHLSEIEISYKIFRKNNSEYDEEGLRWALNNFIGNDWI